MNENKSAAADAKMPVNEPVSNISMQADSRIRASKPCRV
jgi:hypothetical protein